MKVGLHQGSTAVCCDMDIVCSETRSGLPSELLYAEWRESIIDKELKVNAGKSKVMVGSSGRKMIVNSGKWTCGVCGKEVQANTVPCTVCKKWIHKQCSGVWVTCR